jgi:hypothetical protein
MALGGLSLIHAPFAFATAADAVDDANKNIQGCMGCHTIGNGGGSSVRISGPATVGAGATFTVTVYATAGANNTKPVVVALGDATYANPSATFPMVSDPHANPAPYNAMVIPADGPAAETAYEWEVTAPVSTGTYQLTGAIVYRTPDPGGVNGTAISPQPLYVVVEDAPPPDAGPPDAGAPPDAGDPNPPQDAGPDPQPEDAGPPVDAGTPGPDPEPAEQLPLIDGGMAEFGQENAEGAGVGCQMVGGSSAAAFLAFGFGLFLLGSRRRKRD